MWISAITLSLADVRNQASLSGGCNPSPLTSGCSLHICVMEPFKFLFTSYIKYSFLGLQEEILTAQSFTNIGGLGLIPAIAGE